MGKKGELAIVVFLTFVLFGITLASGEVQWGDEGGTPFTTYGENIVCASNDTSAVWSDGTTNIDAMVDCYRADGLSSSGAAQTRCCKTGYECGGTIPGSSCIPAIRNVVSCNSLSRSECESGTYAGDTLPQGIRDHIENDIALSNLGGLHFCDPASNQHIITSEECDYYGNCRCEWINNKCQEKFDITNTCGDEPNLVATCKTTTNNIVDQCGVDNVFVINWTSRLVDSEGNLISTLRVSPSQLESCKDGQKTFPCPESSNLPFFGFWNLIVSLLVIGMIYLFVKRK